MSLTTFLKSITQTIKGSLSSNTTHEETSITIDKVNYSGSNVTIIGNKIIVDGKEVHSKDNIEELIFNGDFKGSISVNGNVTINGNVEGDVSTNTLSCGDIIGEVDANTISCEDIRGDIDANTVTCNNVEGDIDALTVSRK